MTSELRPAVALWSDPSPPNDFCPYDHCSANVPFGTMRIEWKSWKDYPNYCLYFDAGETFIGSFDSLDRAKEHAAAVIEADREAIRAEQAAEVEKLTLTVRKLQGHQAALESYLREIRDKPVARSSDAWKRHCLKLQAIASEALGDVA